MVKFKVKNWERIDGGFMGGSMEGEILVFRRQFLMGPRRSVQRNGWKMIELPEGYFVCAHPDLKLTKSQKGNDCIVLLGYVLDPCSPLATDGEIVEAFLSEKLTFSNLLEKMERIAGRYVCISYLQGKYRIFNDPIGFRQIYYHFDRNEKIWCSSQPAMITEQFGFKSDEEIIKDLYKIPLFQSGGEYWYPGRLSLYKEILHLLPNRFIDVKEKKQIRFWPDKDIKILDIDECTEQITKLLEQLIMSAYSRFELEIAITSGLDSRIILAATHSISSKAHYFTHTHKQLTINGADIAIPSLMAKDLKLNHTVVFHTDELDHNFERIFRKNVTTARLKKGINAYAMYNHFATYGKECVVVHGNAGEISRSFYYLPGIVPVSGETLSVMTGMSKSKLAREQFDMWLDESGYAFKRGIRELDLFYWEQRIANWAAMSYSEYDISFESFSPFSCRKLLILLLSTDEKYRIPPGYKLHYNLISRMWPEVLKYPVNPPKSRAVAIRKKMKATPIYKLYKNIKYLKYVKFM